MVTLPPEFTATKYSGYFWNTETQSLFSVKIDGVLKEIKKVYPNSHNKIDEPGYRISHEGVRRFLSMTYLKKLERTDSEIPVRNQHGNI